MSTEVNNSVQQACVFVKDRHDHRAALKMAEVDDDEKYLYGDATTSKT